MSRRGQNEGSIYKRDDGRWVAVASLGYKNGKRWRKSFYGKTRREVQEKLTEALRTQQRGLPIASERQTVGEFLKHWLEEGARPSVRAATYDSYTRLVRGHIVPAVGHLQLAKLSPQHVQSFINDKLAEGLSPRTVQYLHAVLRRALNQALKWELLPRNVATLVEPPRVRRPEVQPLTTDQVQIFLEAIRGDRLEALYTLVLAVGLRQGEALGLHWTDLELDSGTLSVRTALQRIGGKLCLVEPKTARSRRTITLPPVVVSALRLHRARQLQERLLAGANWQDTGLVFTTTIGTPMDARNLTKRFQKALKEAGLPKKRFHDLRHTCASLLLVQGVHPRVVMEILGHSQMSLTMDTYSHVMPTLQQEAAGLMEALLTQQS